MSNRTEIETKSENKQAVYRFIQNYGLATKQDISVGLGLSLPTIKQALEFLESADLIVPASMIRNTGGRNATGYSVNNSGRFSIGVFLSSNYMSAVCIDLSGTVFAGQKMNIPLDIHNDRYLQKIWELIQTLKDRAPYGDDRFLGVGIAVPSMVSEDGENIIFGMSHDFSGITRSVLSKYIPYPAKMFHDSFAAGFAEVWITPDIKNALYIDLNHTVGGCIIIDNKIYGGNHNRSGEIGHVIIRPQNKVPCYCGNTGCLDTLCNAGVLDNYTNGDLDRFFRLLEADDEKAGRLWDEYLTDLALAIHNFRMLFDCQIILGGYVGAYMENYMDMLCQKVDRLGIFTKYSREYISLGRYRNDSNAAGAGIQMIENYIHSL